MSVHSCMVVASEVAMTENVFSLPKPESIVRPDATIRCSPCGVVAEVETWNNTAFQHAIESGAPLYVIADAPAWACERASNALTLRRYYCPKCNTTLRVR